LVLLFEKISELRF